MLPLRILLVGTDDAAVHDLESALVRLDFPVAGICRSSADLRHSVRLYGPDVVVIDIPAGGGREAMRAVPRLQHDAGAAVVFLADRSDESIVRREAESLLLDYLIKPFHRHELRHALEMAYARHATRERLQASGEQFAATLRSMADCVISTDIMGMINFMNPAAEAITGWRVEEAFGRPLQDVFRVSLPDGAALDSRDLIHQDSGGVRTIFLTDRGGNRVAVEDSTTPIRDLSGSITGLVVVFRSRDGRRRFAHGGSGDIDEWADIPGIVGSIADPLISLDTEWRITYLNSLAADVLEDRREALIGQVLWERLPPSIHRNYFPEFAAALEKGEARSFELEYESRSLWLEVQLYPFGTGVLVLLRDITGRKQAGERRKKMEQLESLGLLARGFAHDFNNLLTVLMGNLSMAEKLLPPDARARDELRAVRQATNQAQNLVQQLLTFARGGAPIREPSTLTTLLHDWMSEWTKRPEIEYRTEVPDVPVVVSIDRHQIRRLLHNLLKNAEQAIPGRGTITVRLRPLRESDPEGPEGVSLEVEDTGSGIPEELIPRVFEPYFTTRQDANASGLGLTVCESIANGHGGGIHLTSSPAGTCVYVTFPQDASVHAAPAVHERRDPGKPRGRRVLVLEDEPLIRHLIVRNLENAGCEVMVTTDGAETVRCYQQEMEKGRRFDLVIMDLSIPGGTGGAQAMERLRQIDPTVCAIVSSGYSDDPVMARYADYGFRAVLPKPYNPNELRELVEELLR